MYDVNGITSDVPNDFPAGVAVKHISFILSIPAILGAFLLQVKDIGSAMDANFLPIVLGFIASFIAGYVAIKWVLDLIQKRSLDIFAYYCWAVGIIVFMGSIAHIF